MNSKVFFSYIAISLASLIYTGCSVKSLVQRKENNNVPSTYADKRQDSTNTATIKWKDFFADPYLVGLIDTALKNNQDLNVMMMQINIAKNEIRARKGQYLPFVSVDGLAGLEKAARYTRNGAVDATTNIRPGKLIPDPLPNFMLGASMSWEIDVWKKLRNTKKSSTLQYLATIEGKNFMITQLVSEIINSYYELMAFDRQLEILKQNIEIQKDALQIVKQQKEAAKVTELAVRRFQAEVLKNQSRQYYIEQMIIVTENRINFLAGRYPQPIQRDSKSFTKMMPASIYAGIPSQLLQNRPDIKQAEMQLEASKLDVKAAKANFYPSFTIMSGVGYQAFNPRFLITTPESMLYSIAGGLTAPLVNRNAIKAAYLSANARQIQAVYNYERTILNAYMEVYNELSNIDNLAKSYDLKEKQVQSLVESITISTGLFQAARADYMEVLLTQRDALESRFELVDTKMQQMHAVIDVYRSLGGGWR